MTPARTHLAIDAARHAAEYGSDRAIYTAEQRRIREMHEEAQRLLEQADRHQIALGNAMGAIHSWIPTAPAVELPATPKRRGLFT